MAKLCFVRCAALAAGLVFACSWADAQPAANRRDPYSLQLQAICQTDFARWDRNHDGELDYREINALIENPQVRGNEAAAVVALYHKLPQKAAGTNGPSLTRARVIALTADYDTWQEYFRLSRHIPTINRTLFLPGDPSVQTLHQGPVGDCYFLGVLGAVVSRDPAAIRKMIKPFPDGSFEVRFPNRQPFHISPLTDSELVISDPDRGNHGIWTAVIEKGFAEVRREVKQDKSGVEIDEDDANTRDLLSGGGRMGNSIATFTGHESKAVGIAGLVRNDPAHAAGQVHAVLGELNQFPHRIMAVATAKKPMPPGMVGGHCYGVLSYDPARRVARLFNPWGNEFTPKGPPGLTNGYPTRFGTFELPLADLVQVCRRLARDTDAP